MPAYPAIALLALVFVFVLVSGGRSVVGGMRGMVVGLLFD